MRPEEIESLSLKDPLSYGIAYVDLLQGRKWEAKSRSWLPDLYKAVSPYHIERYPVGLARKMSVIKCTQCGLSTMAIVRVFHFADFWPTRIFYMLPRQMDVFDFVSTRIDPMLKRSPRLANRIAEPDSNHAKCLGDSYLFFMEASVEPRMMPADALFVDEIDLSDQTNVSVARNRMDASLWKLEYYFSTPTVTNYGIHASYLDSDMREWIVRCPACNLDQIMDWHQNLCIVGPANDPERVYYGCARCKHEITLNTISNGYWLAEKPSRTIEHIGFHVSQMMYYPADVLYKVFRDPKTKLIEFYRKNLGMPYELGEGSLEREDFLIGCFDEVYDPEDEPDGKSRYYLGADQGNELQVVIAKLPPNETRPKIVHVELIPFEEGFDRLGQLMHLYKVRRGVADANPNRHSVANLQKDFPGRLISADYVEQKERYKKTYRKVRKTKTLTGLSMNRTQAFDHLFEQIRKGQWALYGNPTKLPVELELLIDHCTALRRDIETRRTPSGEVDVGVYRSIRADHLAHAMSYCQTAVDLDLEQKGTSRIVVVNTSEEPEEEDEDTDTSKIPPKDILADIISYLAEVPEKQLTEYLARVGQDNYEIPFPLDYKLSLIEGKHTKEHILYGMIVLIDDKRKGNING